MHQVFSFDNAHTSIAQNNVNLKYCFWNSITFFDIVNNTCSWVKVSEKCFTETHRLKQENYSQIWLNSVSILTEKFHKCMHMIKVCSIFILCKMNVKQNIWLKFIQNYNFLEQYTRKMYLQNFVWSIRTTRIQHIFHNASIADTDKYIKYQKQKLQ